MSVCLEIKSFMTYNEWMESMEEKVKKVSRIQASIASFEMLPRLGKILSDKSVDCPECNIYWKQLQEKTEFLELFFQDGNSHRVEFEKVVNEAMAHLKDQHKMRPKGLVLSLYGVLGMVTGVILGFLISYTSLLDISLKGSVIMGWIIGLMVGWFLGKRKERKMGKEGNIF